MGFTRWTTTLPSKVNLPHEINFRTICGHVAVEFWGGEPWGEDVRGCARGRPRTRWVSPGTHLRAPGALPFQKSNN